MQVLLGQGRERLQRLSDFREKCPCLLCLLIIVLIFLLLEAAALISGTPGRHAPAPNGDPVALIFLYAGSSLSASLRCCEPGVLPAASGLRGGWQYPVVVVIVGLRVVPESAQALIPTPAGPLLQEGVETHHLFFHDLYH